MSFVRRPQHGSGLRQTGVLAEFHQEIYKVGTSLLDLVLPPQCLKCNVIVESSGTLCLPCWREIDFTSPPWCRACGLMLEFDPATDGLTNSLCGSCAHRPPMFLAGPFGVFL